MGSPGLFINRSIDMYNEVIVPIIKEYQPLMNETSKSKINEIVAFIRKYIPIVISGYKNYTPNNSTEFNLNSDEDYLSFSFYINRVNNNDFYSRSRISGYINKLEDYEEKKFDLRIKKEDIKDFYGNNRSERKTIDNLSIFISIHHDTISIGIINNLSDNAYRHYRIYIDTEDHRIFGEEYV